MDCIRLRAPVSRAEVSALVGLNRSTVSSIVDDLLERGFVQETEKQEHRVGRPGMLLELNPQGGFAIGVEIGVDFVAVIVANFVGEILWRHRETTEMGEAQIRIIERTENIISRALEEGRERGLRALGIGVGAPGLPTLRLL